MPSRKPSRSSSWTARRDRFSTRPSETVAPGETASAHRIVRPSAEAPGVALAPLRARPRLHAGPGACEPGSGARAGAFRDPRGAARAPLGRLIHGRVGSPLPRREARARERRARWESAARMKSRERRCRGDATRSDLLAEAARRPRSSRSRGPTDVTSDDAEERRKRVLCPSHRSSIHPLSGPPGLRGSGSPHPTPRGSRDRLVLVGRGTAGGRRAVGQSAGR